MSKESVISWAKRFAVDLFWSAFIFMATFGVAYALRPADLLATTATWVALFAAYSASRRP